MHPDHGPLASEDAPVKIFLETISACNARCVMCPHPEVRSSDLRKLPTEIFERCVDEIAGMPSVREVHPFNNNEPLTDKRLPSLVRYIRERLPHVYIRLFSNGSLLTHELSHQLIDSGLNAITFSLHASSEETYNRIMQLSNLRRTCERIEYFHAAAKGAVKVKVTMVDLTLNQEELERTAEHWTSLGIDAYIARSINWAGNLSDSSPLQTYRYEDRPSPCHRVMSEMYVSASGQVILCCADWREEVVFGDVARHSLMEIWGSQEFRRYRELQARQTIDDLKLCNTCTYARRRIRP
jgi:radical SAM protein with 4Fe4S-binding SPASM domain